MQCLTVDEFMDDIQNRDAGELRENRGIQVDLEE